MRGKLLEFAEALDLCLEDDKLVYAIRAFAEYADSDDVYEFCRAIKLSAKG